MSDSIDPNHGDMRYVLRVVGPVIAGLGLLFMVIGFGSFFMAFGGAGPPRYFWCAFIGMPLLAVGASITKFAYIGTVMRYMANETAPVGKDMTNYMVAGTKDSIRDVATAIGEGFAAAGSGRTATAAICPKCGTQNDADAKFCHGCGTPFANVKKCAKCGEENVPTARFCDNCGAAVG